MNSQFISGHRSLAKEMIHRTMEELAKATGLTLEQCMSLTKQQIVEDVTNELLHSSPQYGLIEEAEQAFINDLYRH